MPAYIFTITGRSQSLTVDCDGTLKEVADQLASKGYVIGRIRKLGAFSAGGEKECAVFAQNVVAIAPV